MGYNLRRRNLPHLYFNDGIYFITARLANTIPLEDLIHLRQNFDKRTHLSFSKFKNHFLQYDSLLDKAEKDFIILSDNQIAVILKQCLQYPDGTDYKLICYTIMPNHFHIVFELLEKNKGISKIMQSIKGISARRINKLLNKSGKLWQDESYDRWVRNDIELYFIIKYILFNPIKAGLVNNWFEWAHTYCKPNYIVL